MTSGAIRSGRSLVDVDRLVARYTCRANRLFRDLATVAIEALQLCVPPRQGKFGGLIVIEAHLPPVVGAMAGLAFRAISSLVRVVGLVARNACRAEFLLIQLTGVAGRALDLAVFTCQGKRRFARMVKIYGFPLGCVVAGRTLGAIAAPVSVI